jgi:hypothetical protein
VLTENQSRCHGVEADRFAEWPWPLAYHRLSRCGKDIDTKRWAVMCVVSLSSYDAPFLCLNLERLPIQGLMRPERCCIVRADGLALRVCQEINRTSLSPNVLYSWM